MNSAQVFSFVPIGPDELAMIGMLALPAVIPTPGPFGMISGSSALAIVALQFAVRFCGAPQAVAAAFSTRALVISSADTGFPIR
ncbi:hypothetical protein J2Z31_002593 [Sinorhizobium kostiense]|uniref:Uncharacterized protein n=1 Tax=Sinorhizobium kostiense TaxID=76747 RepID=A0ABS4QZQ3_9HYPH|nr:hypothetical protein [Sinorhizobium kostiense]